MPSTDSATPVLGRDTPHHLSEGLQVFATQVLSRTMANATGKQTANADRWAVPDFPAQSLMLGRWFGWNRKEALNGSNNLLDYELAWVPDPHAPLQLPDVRANEPVGFERFLNCLHPDDMALELQNIRKQLLNGKSVSMDRMRMCFERNSTSDVYVRREFGFAPHGGELLALRITLALDVSRSVFND